MILPPTENLRRHWWRATLRISGLIGADLAVFWLLRYALRATREGLLVEGFAVPLSSFFPKGFVSGFEFAVALVLSGMVVGAYRPGEARKDPGRLITASGLAALLCLYGNLWSQASFLALFQVVAVTVFFGITLSTVRLALDAVVQRIQALHSPMHVVAIHDGKTLPKPVIDALLRGPGYGSEIVAEINIAEQEDIAGRLRRLIHSEQVDTVVLAGGVPEGIFGDVMDEALAHGCRLLATARTQGVARTIPKRIWISGVPLTELTAPALQRSQLALKRAFDIAAASAVLLCFAPLLAVLAFSIKLDSPGPVLFRQRRLGLGGQTFTCLKFRSMIQDAERVLRSEPELYELYRSGDYKLPAEIDPRLTKLGRFMRRTSLDELPQLFNVIKGDISLVGPRPVIADEMEHYRDLAPLFLSVKPGMTGFWAIAGRSRLRYPERAAMELEYVRGWNVRSDLRILIKTLRVVFEQTGAF